MTARQLSDGNDDGQVLGQSATDKVAFYGSTAVVQPSGSTQAAVATTVVSTAATSTSPFGFATATQADNLMEIVNANRALVNQLRSDLVTLGLIKGSA